MNIKCDFRVKKYEIPLQSPKTYEVCQLPNMHMSVLVNVQANHSGFLPAKVKRGVGRRQEKYCIISANKYLHFSVFCL